MKLIIFDPGFESTDDVALYVVESAVAKLTPKERRRIKERKAVNNARGAQARQHGWHIDDRRRLSPKIAVTPDQFHALKTGHTVNVLGTDLVSDDGLFRIITDEEMAKLRAYDRSSTDQKALSNISDVIGKISKSR